MTKQPTATFGSGKRAQEYHTRVQPELRQAPWVLRITEHSDKTGPVMVIKERIAAEDRIDAGQLTAPRSITKERGTLYGESQRRCLPVVRRMVARVQDRQGIPLELHRYLEGSKLIFRGNLPLDEEAGVKLALLFKLQERIKEVDRVELIARRIDRFTREEAAYWYSRMTSFAPAANRWALAGMKVMLSGTGGDPALQAMLEELRNKY
ncbi:DUF7680 family protein [Desulfobulbus alkaliphilus]|uniref:DUF7680 family protein n=1 Tax=Desulfobulbus alkaliphilus TaxID=869814 RepID=UPI001962D07D|nr:hypothetical protein [Desulfobulbus alkaliphilus]MBM9535981.1 hypothetical protein [Desulfobulbus alkaliphilus]